MERAPQWYAVEKTLKMADGEERSQEVAHIAQSWPRFFRFCKDDVGFEKGNEIEFKQN